MMPGQINGDAKISQLWDIGYGVTQRVVDIINQCRYLASKRGMNLKEIRLSMREDEAKQRQLVRYADLCNQQIQCLSPSGIHDVLYCNSSSYPTWFSHANNHGMIYSQYNTQNYGNMGLSDPRSYHSTNSAHSTQTNQKSWEYHKENLAKEEKGQTNLSTKQSFETKSVMPNPANQGNDKVLNLLYSANLSEKTSGSHTSVQDLETSSCELITKREKSNSRSLGACESVLKCNLPARKLATHNLASLCAAEGNAKEDQASSKLFGNTYSKSSFIFNRNDESDSSELEFSEIQVVEEIDKEKRVISPLIKKVESAFEDLKQTDTLFGTMDDFGHLMNQANHIF